jgi:hypothetical protein
MTLIVQLRWAGAVAKVTAEALLAHYEAAFPRSLVAAVDIFARQNQIVALSSEALKLFPRVEGGGTEPSRGGVAHWLVEDHLEGWQFLQALLRAVEAPLVDIVAVLRLRFPDAGSTKFQVSIRFFPEQRVHAVRMELCW